jgi:hypothetical protein
MNEVVHMGVLLAKRSKPKASFFTSTLHLKKNKMVAIGYD